MDLSEGGRSAQGLEETAAKPVREIDLALEAVAEPQPEYVFSNVSHRGHAGTSIIDHSVVSPKHSPSNVPEMPTSCNWPQV